MHSNRKMASALVNSGYVDMAEFQRQKKEIKELLDTQLVEGDAWYIYWLSCVLRFIFFGVLTIAVRSSDIDRSVVKMRSAHLPMFEMGYGSDVRP